MKYFAEKRATAKETIAPAMSSWAVKVQVSNTQKAKQTTNVDITAEKLAFFKVVPPKLIVFFVINFV